MEEINFRYVNNLILIDVQIENNTYTCALDTGADVSLLDNKLLSKIPHKEVTNKKVSGSSGVKNNFNFIEIPKVNIGNLEFSSLIAISSDFYSFSNAFICDETIHGIIGSNLMRKAKWRIDYQQQKIWISDKLSSFNDLNDEIIVQLDCGKVGDAYINVSLDGVEEQYGFDTGKTTKLQSNIKTFNKLLKVNENLEYTKVKGTTGITLNGIQYGTTNYTLIEEVKIGEITLNNQIVEMENNKKSSSLIGNEIWENYIITIDYDNCDLYLSPNQKIKSDTLYTFQYNIYNNKAKNSFNLENEWLQHSTKLNISQHNEITHIEGIKVSNMNTEEYCNFLKNKLPSIKKQNTISIILLNAGKKEEVTLSKQKLLPK